MLCTCTILCMDTCKQLHTRKQEVSLQHNVWYLTRYGFIEIKLLQSIKWPLAIIASYVIESICSPEHVLEYNYAL